MIAWHLRIYITWVYSDPRLPSHGSLQQWLQSWAHAQGKANRIFQDLARWMAIKGQWDEEVEDIRRVTAVIDDGI